MFRHLAFNMLDLKINTCELFSHLEVVGRGSETQLRVGENLII